MARRRPPVPPPGYDCCTDPNEAYGDPAYRTVAGGGNPADGLGDGGLATEARLEAPTQLVLDGAGNLFIADNDGFRIRRVGPVGIISTVAGSGAAGFAGDGGPAIAARLNEPYGIAIDRAGHLYIWLFSTSAAADHLPRLILCCVPIT